jgi:hypothetical protein
LLKKNTNFQLFDNTLKNFFYLHGAPEYLELARLGGIARSSSSKSNGLNGLLVRHELTP